MPKFRLLSLPLRSDDPSWPGAPPPARTEVYSAISQGDVANQTVIHLFSHSGTHLDAPKHFNDAGAIAADLPIESYIFFKPTVIEIPRGRDGAITRADLEPFTEQIKAADIVCLRTGWSAQRSTDPATYAEFGPRITTDAAQFFMDNFPDLRGIAIDAVSIAAPHFVEDARKAHWIFTGVGREDGRFILLFEDLRIDSDLGDAVRIYTIPLYIPESDGSPCTIFAEFAD